MTTDNKDTNVEEINKNEKIEDKKIKNKKNKEKKMKDKKAKKKRINILKPVFVILIVLILLVFAPMQTTTYKTLINGEWENEVGTIYFDKLLHFSFYNAGSGNPVGNADMYPFYIFLGNKNFITLGSFPIVTGKIHHIDDRYMILIYDGETYFFNNMNAFELGDKNAYFNYEATCDKCFESAKDIDTSYVFCKVSNINDKNITIEPFEFHNKEENKACKYTFDLANKVNYDYSKQESELVDEYTVYTHKCESKDLTKDEAVSLLKDKSQNAFVRFNKNGKVSDIIVADTHIKMLELTTMERVKIEREIEEREYNETMQEIYPEE